MGLFVVLKCWMLVVILCSLVRFVLLRLLRLSISIEILLFLVVLLSVVSMFCRWVWCGSVELCSLVIVCLCVVLVNCLISCLFRFSIRVVLGCRGLGLWWMMVRIRIMMIVSSSRFKMVCCILLSSY